MTNSATILPRYQVVKWKESTLDWTYLQNHLLYSFLDMEVFPMREKKASFNIQELQVVTKTSKNWFLC